MEGLNKLIILKTKVSVIDGILTSQSRSDT